MQKYAKLCKYFMQNYAKLRKIQQNYANTLRKIAQNYANAVTQNYADITQNHENALRKITQNYANKFTQKLRKHFRFTQLDYADITQTLRKINYAIITHITQSLRK